MVKTLAIAKGIAWPIENRNSGFQMINFRPPLYNLSEHWPASFSRQLFRIIFEVVSWAVTKTVGQPLFSLPLKLPNAENLIFVLIVRVDSYLSFLGPLPPYSQICNSVQRNL